MKPRTVEARESKERGEVKFVSGRPCCRCGGVLFYSNFKNRKTPKCVHCTSVQSSSYASENKERMHELNKAWNENNKDYVKAKNKAYYENNKEDIKAGRRAYYQQNKEKIIKQKTEYARKKRQMEKEAELLKNGIIKI